MSAREHMTDDNLPQMETAPRPPRAGQGGYVSPTHRRWAEQIERDARPPADTFTMPTTAAELDAMSYPERARVHTADPALYDRLTGRAPAA
ncbi:hypothetical protein [Streptomyces sp. NPDC051561]|uniref:hypothetical protein n=1 Tax=Streptomyces sp. NPDC051561 TaxID=3365658 RepID=UPI0037877007